MVVLIFYYLLRFHMGREVCLRFSYNGFQEPCFENAQERAVCSNTGSESCLTARACSSDILCFSFRAQLSSKYQCCCPRPLLQMPVPSPLKDVLYKVHHNLLLLFVGMLSHLQGGKDVLVTKINWMGWLDRQFLFLFML